MYHIPVTCYGLKNEELEGYYFIHSTIDEVWTEATRQWKKSEAELKEQGWKIAILRLEEVPVG